MCDAEAYKTLFELGIVQLYDRFEFLPPAEGIDGKVFWSYPKLVALKNAKAPCCVIDTDCVLWRKIPYAPDVVALHTEPLEFGTYGYNRMWDLLDRIMPDKMRGHKMVKPYNTAVIAFNSDEARKLYTYTSLELMYDYTKAMSKQPELQGNNTSGTKDQPIREIIFAEQLLLGILADRAGFKVETIAEYDAGTDHMNAAPGVMHLWNSKWFLKEHTRAREQYISAIMEELFEFRNSTRWSSVAAAIHKCGLPTVRVTETNWDTIRWSHAGEWVGPGENAITI